MKNTKINNNIISADVNSNLLILESPCLTSKELGLGRDFTKPRKNFKLNPNWVTGFIDGEGSFIIAILPSTGVNKKKNLFKN